MLFMSIDPVASLLLWGVKLQDTKGISHYCTKKTVPRSNLLYHQVYPLHNLVKREGHFNHSSLSPRPFYLVEADQQDCIREPIYSYCTYVGASTLPSQTML
jgi:hypothetical protein